MTHTIESVCFVVPTYNEAQNIAPLLHQLLGIIDSVPWQGHVLVVDDSSPDGTGVLVTELAQTDARVRLLSGQREGLGAAYTRGMQYVLDEMQVDAIVQMDADFSHAPMDATRLIAGLEDADVVVGSRYVAGGSIDLRWGRRRRLLSRGGNLCARLIAGIKGVRDCTAGFKAIRVRALRSIMPLRLSVQGYVFQVAMLHALMIDGARIKEIPIHFYDRHAGETKLGWKDSLEFFVHVWWLRLLARKTFIKFCLTGLSGVVVNLGSFVLLLGAGVNPYLSSPIAVELSIIWNFFINNYWTFRDRRMSTRKRVRGLRYNAIALSTLALSFATFALVHTAYPEFREVVAQLIAVLPAALVNYFANSYWTFKADPQSHD
ncbi:MAG: glycosyltransferase family 2 protein [Pseudomonadota bacterium]